MKLTKEQFEREGNYRLAVAVMRTLRGKGFLTELEYCKANERLVDRYNCMYQGQKTYRAGGGEVRQNLPYF